MLLHRGQVNKRLKRRPRKPVIGNRSIKLTVRVTTPTKHNFNSTTLGLAATIHASATMPNFLITEYFVNLEEFGKDICENPFQVENGYIKLPENPGLGINIDENALKKYPYKQFPPRALRQFYEEGP